MRRGRMLTLLLLCLCLFATLIAGTASANSGPPRYQGDKGGVVLPGATDQVHVLREELRFDLDPELHKAQVTARYEMENRGPAQKEFPVIFVTQGGGNRTVSVTWGGNMIPASVLDTSALSDSQKQEMDAAWTAMDTLVDPVSGVRLTTKDFYGGGGVRYVRFSLPLEAGAKGTLQVTYSHGATQDHTRYTHRVSHYQYLLLPARGWASFGPLEIRVKAPGPDDIYFASTIPMKYEGGEYVASLPGLPSENLAFGVMSKAGLIAGITQPGPYFWMAFVLVIGLGVAIGIGIGSLAGRVPSRGWAIGVGIISGILVGGLLDLIAVYSVFGLMVALPDQGYEKLFIGLGQFLAAVVLTTIFAGVWAARKNRRKYAA